MPLHLRRLIAFDADGRLCLLGDHVNEVEWQIETFFTTSFRASAARFCRRIALQGLAEESAEVSQLQVGAKRVPRGSAYFSESLSRSINAYAEWL